ncbi:GNAT family N-acetyltransferase [Francisella frigiditurris]|uniref:Acetyltransferase family protein n=1 Tax=Francisella frigiditurris TaxID=1542390 RepID=A0A1J0KR66_9GAMM|nr:GNAT family N-acetyltransferase [Francisella frigiditurris]APC96239.1 acetyltransferase family protein [Francisella frigiditurris]
MDFKVTLKNETIQLIQMEEKHFEDLYKVASDPKIWEQHFDERWKLDVFQKYFDIGLANKEGCFVIIDLKKNQIIGSTRFYRYDPKDQSVKIGYTFISTEYWGSKINRIIKKLMLDYAFEYLERVYFDVWEYNYRSQKAVEKLGAIKVESNEKGKFLYQLDRDKWLK